MASWHRLHPAIMGSDKRYYGRLMLVAPVGLLCAAGCLLALYVEESLGKFASAFVSGFICAGVLGVTSWYLFSSRWLRPLRELSREVSRIVKADWAGQVIPRGGDELCELAGQFNQIAMQTQKRLAKLTLQQADLNALVDTLPDPLVAVDGLGRLILMNSPASTLLGLSAQQAMKQRLVSAISDRSIVELFEAVISASAEGDPLARGTPLIQREIHLARAGHRLTYQAVAAPTAGGGVLVVMRDVTALAGAVQMKTDFVANASHELRTPITAIKIAFETLREAYGEDPAQARKCMEVIDGHLARLEEMLRDLLDLSRVEGPENEPAITEVKTEILFDSIRSALSPMARQKLVELEFDEHGVDSFQSDARLLGLILKNLVENSVKYTPVGGRVSISVREASEGGVSLVVADTGIGIAPEHIERVFERFYQVDSARSGSAGRGTGLGLAIVKHAVNALRGTVRLESQPGVGTTVTCLLPGQGSAGAAA